MESMFLDSANSVLDDINDLEDTFGYFRDSMEDEEENSQEVSGVEEPVKRKRGRPPKDPSASMSAHEKSQRRMMLVAACERFKNR